MLNKFSYVCLILLAIYCWHCTALPRKGKTRDPVDSSLSKEDSSRSKKESSHSHEHSSQSKKDSSHSKEDSSQSKKDSSNSKEDSSHSHEHSSSKEKERLPKPTKKPPAKTVTTIAPARITTSPVTTTTTTLPETTTTTLPETTTTLPETTTTTLPETTTTLPETTRQTLTVTVTITTTSTVILEAASPTCDFECKNNGMCTSHNHCTCPNGFGGPTCEAQSVGLCLNDETSDMKTILLITFGNGSAQYSTVTPASFDFSTTYQQRFEPITKDGAFSFINSIHDDFNGAWHTNATDHSEGDNGYMYLVNADYTPGQFYNGRVDNLCVGLRYEFSVYLANLCKKSGRINPNVRFEVRSVVGDDLLAQLDSGDIAEHDSLTWEKYGLSFIATSSSVKLLMISNARGGSGNDIVIDDIALRVCAHEGAGFCPSN